jgi:hypothetical protein
MHRFRWLSLLGVTCTFVTFGLAACGDDGGDVPPNTPDAATSPDAPGNPDLDAAPGGIDAGADAGDGPDAGPRPDAAPPVLGGIVISEVVLFPQQDWGKSAGVGLPFDGIAGTGSVSSRDQYIEIYNSGTSPVSLSGWSIAVVDSSDGEESITPLANDTEEGVVLSLGGGSVGSVLDAGDYAVLGNPVGTIANDAYIALRDNRSVVVDDVEIGVDDFEDMDGDDGAPAAGQNGYSLGEFDESIARPSGQVDTNDDRIDFEKMFATPLGPNVPPSPSPTDTAAPRASAPPGTGNWRVNQLVRVVFNERLRASALTPADLELRVGGVVRPLYRLSFANSDSIIQVETVGVLPFSTTVTLTARASILDYAGNALGTDATFTFTTEAAPANNPSVLINEVCTDPQQDWNHSSDNGTPFTNVPGTNPASRSSSDEYIELIVSAGGQSVNMNGYTLEVFNGPNIEAASVQVTALNDAKVSVRELQFSSGALTSVPAGARVVVGNPTGSMENDIYLVLRDNNGVILDEVEIGGIAADTDRGGDGINIAGAGAPDIDLNGNASGAGDETIARVNSGGPVDTGSDTADWVQVAASILQTN